MRVCVCVGKNRISQSSSLAPSEYAQFIAPIIASRVSLEQYEGVAQVWCDDASLSGSVLSGFLPPVYLPDSRLLYFDMPGHKEGRKVGVIMGDYG